MCSQFQACISGEGVDEMTHNDTTDANAHLQLTILKKTQ